MTESGESKASPAANFRQWSSKSSVITIVEFVGRYAVRHRGIDLPKDAFDGLIAGFELFDRLDHAIETPIDDGWRQRRRT